MSDISLLELAILVHFFYSRDYDEPSSTATGQGCRPISLLHLHTRMFAHGDRYDAPALRHAAAEKYLARCTKAWDAVELLQSIPFVYESTPPSIRSLRDVVACAARKRLKVILTDSSLAATHDKLVTAVPDYAKDLLLLCV
jgi:hypothetical protein